MRFAAALLCLLAVGVPALALGQETAPALAAPAALERAHSGELLLIDVRHPQEWRETGLATPAEPLSIHDPGGLPAFVEKLQALAGPPEEAPALAFVCATGVRSAFAADVARRLGYGEVYNLQEGMLGSEAGPGWLARALPVEPCQVC